MSTLSDIWGVAKGVLGVVAPLAATMVGGPLAGTATTAIIKALGLADDTTPAQAAAAVVGATPDQLAALRKMDNDLQIALRQADIAEESLTFEDKKSARDMQISTKSWVPGVLSLLVTFGFFGLLLLTCFVGFPAANVTLLNVLLGSLGAAWTAVISYWFGSSAHSAAQSAMLFASSPASVKK